MRPSGGDQQAEPVTLPHAGAETTVRLRDGLLRGLRKGAVRCWRGVPYAAPPVGPLRFRSPRPVQSWQGVRDATRFGPSAPQPSSRAEQVLGVDAHEPSSEDCLTLNIWSQGPGGLPRPVMVWLHGGSFLTGAGSDSLYDGHGFAARGDVVIVTLNVRLGALGFLHLGGIGSAAFDENLGLRDQIAALRWVRDNIEAFGGDPGAVTLFGQSAGAMAIGALLGVPDARALFHRAILQSGAAQHVHDRGGADRVARRMLRTLGMGTPDSEALRALPVDDLVAASRKIAAHPGLQALAFQPVVDGVLLPVHPLDAVRAGAAAGLPLLLGTTRDELDLYGVIAEQDPSPSWRKRLRRARAVASLARTLGSRRLLRLRRAYPEGTAGLLELAADAVFGIPAIRLAEAQAVHAPVFVYRFDWPSPAYGGRLGACHALDVPFVWATMDTPGAQRLTGGEPGARSLATAMQDAWIAFARTGEPRAQALPPWPGYELSTRPTMIFNTVCRVDRDPHRARRQAWAEPA